MFLCHVVFDACPVGVTFFADSTSVWFGVVMSKFMTLEVIPSSKGQRTVGALVWFLSSVKPDVTFHVVFSSKCSEAYRAAVNTMFIICVFCDRIWCVEKLVTQLAFKKTTGKG